MGSTLQNVKKIKQRGNKMSTKDKEVQDDTYINPADDDWGFVGGMDETVAHDDRLLPDNVAASAINCGFIGVGGGGGKLAKAFLDLGFNKTLLVNTTDKDQPAGVEASHFLNVPGADGVGKDVALGKKVLSDNSALVEDACRSRLGKLDWLFVMAGGGGGTGSACHALDGAFSRYLKSLESEGSVVYVVTKPSAQELLNPSIETNYNTLLEDINDHPHIVIDNERQLQLLRGKVGMLNMYPAANATFAKLLGQVLKLADTPSDIAAFDSNDLERCLRTSGRIFIGSTVIKDTSTRDLGSSVFQGCLKGSPCPSPTGQPETGVLLLLATSVMASDPDVSNRLEACAAYVGGRTNTLFQGVYINDKVPGLIALVLFGGMN